MPPRTNTAGLSRDLEILDLLAEQTSERQPSLGVSRVAELLQRNPSQVSRALSTLAAAGIVERDADTRGYRIGWKVFALASLSTESRLAAVATPYLRRVAARTGETTVLCVLRGSDLLTIAVESSSKPLRGVRMQGSTVPAAATSAGRVLVSEWPDDAVRDFFTPQRLSESGQQPRLLTPVALLEELAAIRARGYAVVEDEFEADLVGCSAPVRGADGHVVAAVNITAPKARFGAWLEQGGRYLAQVAGELSVRFSGGSGPSSPSAARPGHPT
jgi:DNA-binding IclR family transcriptional regulator